MVKEESEIDINWLKGNRMIVNPDKIQTIEIKINRQMMNSSPLNIMDENNNPEAGAKLFRIDTNDKLLTFDNDISTVSKRAGNQLKEKQNSQGTLN